jgi:hypothetical protein
MKKLIIISFGFFLLASCKKEEASKEKALSPANGTYQVNIQYHYAPYRSGWSDTALKDIDTNYTGSIVVTGNVDTVYISTIPADLYGNATLSGSLAFSSDNNDTLKYVQPYPALTGAGSGLVAKTLLFEKINGKINFSATYVSGHNGSFAYKISQ